jgi:hypothetical protein
MKYPSDFHNKHDNWYDYYDNRISSKIKKFFKFISKKIDEICEALTNNDRFIY